MDSGSNMLEQFGDHQASRSEDSSQANRGTSPRSGLEVVESGFYTGWDTWEPNERFEKVEAKVDEWAAARRNRDFATADRLRDELRATHPPQTRPRTRRAKAPQFVERRCSGLRPPVLGYDFPSAGIPTPKQNRSKTPSALQSLRCKRR